jgi:anti-anti-sigma factor
MKADDTFHCEVEHSELPATDVRDSLGNKVTTVRCHGRLVMQTKGHLENVFRHTAFRGHIYIDLDDVSYLDSAGLAALVRLKFSAAREGGVNVKLMNVGPRVMRLLRITHLLEWFAS